MLFSSQPFLLLFLPLSLLAYYRFANSYTARIAILTGASMAFYAWWDPRFVPLLGGMILMTWLVVRLESVMRRSWILLVGVALNLSVLGLFKYANFFAENVLSTLGVAHQSWNIILPLGISFFTFQQISYLVERYRGIADQLAHPGTLTDEAAMALAREGKAIVDVSGGLHASEVAGSCSALPLGCTSRLARSP